MSELANAPFANPSNNPQTTDFKLFLEDQVKQDSAVIRFPEGVFRIYDKKDLLQFGKWDIHYLAQHKIQVAEDIFEAAAKEYTSMTAEIIENEMWLRSMGRVLSVTLQRVVHGPMCVLKVYLTFLCYKRVHYLINHFLYFILGCLIDYLFDHWFRSVDLRLYKRGPEEFQTHRAITLALVNGIPYMSMFLKRNYPMRLPQHIGMPIKVCLHLHDKLCIDCVLNYTINLGLVLLKHLGYILKIKCECI
uniref:Uncharacterized protein n=1 Tax=Lactuca sativa TaxID=4236 RepID=A0A9R1UNJ0_LACSA|nr:hypothetical protein LSAT_V11C800415160 [Lactuca sativa]